MTRPLINRRLVLAERPHGVPEPRHFRRDDVSLPGLAEGEFLVRNLCLSIDPAQRGWVNAGANYSQPVAIGAVMRALAVGQVMDSRNPQIARGDYLYGWFGWQDYCVATRAAVLCGFDPAHGSPSLALGVYGIPGITAYLALTDLGRPKAGETVVVSTAAGAVGSIVGQIARRLGCRVIGITGSAEKVQQCCSQFGYSAAINYRHGLEAAQLAEVCPQGVDVFFDNTSGAIADAVWPLLNIGGRVVQCGTAAVATWSPPPMMANRHRDVLIKRLSHQGFIIFDHAARFPGVIAQLASWVAEGSLVFREDIREGLDAAPEALAALYRGENHGKMVIRL